MSYQRRYGHDPPKRREALAYYTALKRILSTADAPDGSRFPPHTREALHRLVAHVYPELAQELEAFEPAGEELVELLPIRAGRSYVRMLVYDAIWLCTRCGSYDALSRDAITRTARSLHVSRALMVAMEGIAAAEIQLDRSRRELFQE